MTRAPDFTIGEFLAWARTKPADEQYDFCDPGKCALAQFGAATLRPHLVNLMSHEIEALCEGLLAAVLGLGRQGTFGSLVTRLEALLPAEPVSATWTKADAYLTDIEATAADVAREQAA